MSKDGRSNSLPQCSQGSIVRFLSFLPAATAAAAAAAAIAIGVVCCVSVGSSSSSSSKSMSSTSLSSSSTTLFRVVVFGVAVVVVVVGMEAFDFVIKFSARFILATSLHFRPYVIVVDFVCATCCCC